MRRAHGDVLAVSPEGHLVNRLDAELVSQLLRDHHLTFGPYAMSHTEEYDLMNHRAIAPLPGLGHGRSASGRPAAP